MHCFAGPAPDDAEPRCASWEIDQAAFLPLDEARNRIHPDQAPFLDRLVELLGETREIKGPGRPPWAFAASRRSRKKSSFYVLTLRTERVTVKPNLNNQISASTRGIMARPRAPN